MEKLDVAFEIYAIKPNEEDVLARVIEYCKREYEKEVSVEIKIFDESVLPYDLGICDSLVQIRAIEK